MTPETFVDAMSNLRFQDVFNPYAHACADHDVDDAPSIRRNNLRLVLDAAVGGGVDSMWVARDLGYRGGRRTGLALTDEIHLADHAGLYGRLPLARATRGPVMAERTAAVTWRILREVGRPIFLWNVFPLHPHATASPFTNRPHSRAEREASRHLIQWLVATLQPRTLVAIGRDAASALAEFDLEASAVRHPSYGGQNEFIAQMRGLYGIRTCAESQPSLL